MDWGVYILAGTALLFVGSLLYLVVAIVASRRQRRSGGQAQLTLPAAVVTVEPYDDEQKAPAWVPPAPARDVQPAPAASDVAPSPSGAEAAIGVTPPRPSSQSTVSDVASERGVTMEDILSRPIRTGDWQPDIHEGPESVPQAAESLEPDLADIAASLETPAQEHGPYRARRKARDQEHLESEVSDAAPPEPPVPHPVEHPMERETVQSDLSQLLAQLSALGLTVAPVQPPQYGPVVMPPQTMVFPQVMPAAPQYQYAPQYVQPVPAPPAVYPTIPGAPPTIFVPPTPQPVAVPTPPLPVQPPPPETISPVPTPPVPVTAHVAPPVATETPSPVVTPAPPVTPQPSPPTAPEAVRVPVPGASQPGQPPQAPDRPDARVAPLPEPVAAPAPEPVVVIAEPGSRPPVAVAIPSGTAGAPSPVAEPPRPHVTLRVASRPVEAAAAHAAQSTRTLGDSGRDATTDAPPDLQLVSPVEMWFGDKRIGVTAGSKTFEEFQRLAGILFDDLKASGAR